MKKNLLITLLLFSISYSWGQTKPKKEEFKATEPIPVSTAQYNIDKKNMKVIKSEVVDYDFVVTYIDPDNNIKSYSIPLTYENLKVPQVVDNKTFDIEKSTAKILSDEVEDNYYVIKYLDNKGVLKKHQIPLTNDSPFLFANPLIVDKNEYSIDKSNLDFKLVNEEVEDNDLAITYFDSLGILKKYKTPLTNSMNHLPIIPLTVNEEDYDSDKMNPKFKIIKDEIEDYYHVVTYFDKNNILKKYQTPITSTSPYKIITPIYVDSITYAKNGGARKFKRVSAEIKDYSQVITYFSNDTLKIYQAPISTTGLISSYKHGFAGFSLLTVPFKIRPRANGNSSSSKADINNIGLFSGYSWSWERWHYNDETTTFKIAVGGYLAPSVEELTPENSSVTKNTNQCYVTTALAITLNWNKLNFAIIPLAADSGLSPTSRKWIYDGNFWWGFGLGIDTSLFQF